MAADDLAPWSTDDPNKQVPGVQPDYMPLPGFDQLPAGVYGPPATVAATPADAPAYGPPASLAAPPASTQALDQQIAADQRQVAADAPLAATGDGATVAAGAAPAQSGGAPAQIAPPADPDALMGPTIAGQTAALPPIPPMPEPAPPTGNHELDVQNGIAYSRQLQAHGEKLAAYQQSINSAKAAAQGGQSDAELKAERERAAAAAEERKRYAAERKERQDAINAAVDERSKAAKDLEGASWAKQSTGSKILSLIAIAVGGRAQQLSNIARVQLHQAPDAQNEVLKQINDDMARDYKMRSDRLAAASSGLLEARYGFKDAAENHRAALNDLDAETSAKYKLIAKETESQLRKAGAGQAEIDQNAIVLDARQKANAAEEAIHEREEGHEDTREKSKAELAMAGAHLALGERTATATEALGRGHLDLARSEAKVHKGEFDEREADRRAAAAAAKEAKKGKADEDLDKRALRDPDTDELIGYAGTPRAVPKLAEKLVAAKAYSSSLRNLADDIEKNGRVGSDLPIIGTEAGKQRVSLHAEAVARGRKALELGVSNANMQLEHSSIGGTGAGLSRIGSPAQLRRIADENDRIADQTLRANLKGASDEQKANSGPPAVAPRAAAPAAKAPATKPQIMRIGTGPGAIEYHLQPDGTYK